MRAGDIENMALDAARDAMRDMGGAFEPLSRLQAMVIAGTAAWRTARESSGEAPDERRASIKSAVTDALIAAMAEAVSAKQDQAEHRSKLIQRINGLSHDQQMALSLRLHHELTQTEAAAVMQCDGQRVAHLMQAALEELRPHLP